MGNGIEFFQIPDGVFQFPLGWCGEDTFGQRGEFFFDFLIRKRELTQVEVAALPPALETPADTPDPYPQREAVLWALRELTDKDASASTAAWRRLFRNP